MCEFLIGGSLGWYIYLGVEIVYLVVGEMMFE